MDSSSPDEESDYEETESIGAFIQVDRCEWDTRYFYFDNDPIYDKENDEYEMAKFWPCVQPKYSMIQPQIYLQMQKGDFHIPNITEIFQPCTSLVYNSQVYKDPFDNDPPLKQATKPSLCTS